MSNQKPNEQLDLLTIDVAAKELGISPTSLRRLIAEGKIKPVMVGGSARFSRLMLSVWQTQVAGGDSVQAAMSRLLTLAGASDRAA